MSQTDESHAARSTAKKPQHLSSTLPHDFIGGNQAYSSLWFLTHYTDIEITQSEQDSYQNRALQVLS